MAVEEGRGEGQEAEAEADSEAEQNKTQRRGRLSLVRERLSGQAKKDMSGCVGVIIFQNGRIVDERAEGCRAGLLAISTDEPGSSRSKRARPTPAANSRRVIHWATGHSAGGAPDHDAGEPCACA